MLFIRAALWPFHSHQLRLSVISLVAFCDQFQLNRASLIETAESWNRHTGCLKRIVCSIFLLAFHRLQRTSRCWFPAGRWDGAPSPSQRISGPVPSGPTTGLVGPLGLISSIAIQFSVLSGFQLQFTYSCLLSWVWPSFMFLFNFCTSIFFSC